MCLDGCDLGLCDEGVSACEESETCRDICETDDANCIAISCKEFRESDKSNMRQRDIDEMEELCAKDLQHMSG